MIASIITICKLMTVFNVINNLSCASKELNVTRFISEDLLSAERFFVLTVRPMNSEDHGLP